MTDSYGTVWIDPRTRMDRQDDEVVSMTMSVDLYLRKGRTDDTGWDQMNMEKDAMLYRMDCMIRISVFKPWDDTIRENGGRRLQSRRWMWEYEKHEN